MSKQRIAFSLLLLFLVGAVLWPVLPSVSLLSGGLKGEGQEAGVQQLDGQEDLSPAEHRVSAQAHLSPPPESKSLLLLPE